MAEPRCVQIVVSSICEEFGISRFELYASSNNSLAQAARGVAAQILLKDGGLSPKQIGRFLGRKEHTVRFLIGKADVLRATNSRFSSRITQAMHGIERRIRTGEA